MTEFAQDRWVGERRRWRGLEWLLLAVVVAFVVFCGVWRVTGGTWREVETPSMGTVAPVGSLLWVRPVDPATLKVGDFISFHPPGRTAVTYSHRVYRIDAQGIMTKGEIPAADPWHLTGADVVGKVTAVWWGVGWLVVAAPILLVGGIITAAICGLSRKRWRLPIAILLGSLTLTVAITWYRPFLNASQIAFAPTADGATATYVGTGLLPVRLSASQPSDASRPDGSAVMRDGQVGTVTAHSKDPDGRWRVNLSPAIPWWWWVVLVLVCFVPALWSLLVGLPPFPEMAASEQERVSVTAWRGARRRGRAYAPRRSRTRQRWERQRSTNRRSYNRIRRRR